MKTTEALKSLDLNTLSTVTGGAAWQQPANWGAQQQGWNAGNAAQPGQLGGSAGSTWAGAGANWAK